MPSKDSKQAEDVGPLLSRSMTIVCEDSVSSHSLPMCPVSPRVMPSKDSKLAEDVEALLIWSRTIITEFGTDSGSVAEASAIAIEPPMHGPHEAWRLNFIDHEQIEPIIPSSNSRKRKVLSEGTNNELKVRKRPAAAIKTSIKVQGMSKEHSSCTRIHIDAKDQLPYWQG